MQEHDRVFLRDFLNLTFKHHMMTVEALLNGGADGQRLAAMTLRRADPNLTVEQANDEEARLNERARFQTVMFGKILAEFVGALEDFGALCHAVRKRTGRGVLREFFASETGAVASFYDNALKASTSDLGDLLRLPTLSSIRGKLSAADYSIAEHHYSAGAGFVRQMAKLYRDPPQDGDPAPLIPLRGDWKNCMHILLDAYGDREGAKGLFAWTFNRLKHRFAVLESVEEYAALPIATECAVVAVDKGDARVALLVNATRDASMGAAEIAATMLFLDEHDALR